MSTDKMVEAMETFYGVPAAMCDAFVRRSWEACWTASREAQVFDLPKPYAVIGDYAACGGSKAVWSREFAEKIDDRMCEKTAVYDVKSLRAAGFKVSQ